MERNPAASGYVPTDAFRLAMRQLASGVTLITTGEESDRRGITATAVCSLSTEPPSLLACVNRHGESFAAIQRNRSFCVNIIAAGQKALAQRFSGQGGLRGVQRFAGIEWTLLATGAPVLTSSLASFDCELVDTVHRATHAIFIGGVRAVRISTDQRPLVYQAGDYHTITDLM